MSATNQTSGQNDPPHVVTGSKKKGRPTASEAVRRSLQDPIARRKRLAPKSHTSGYRLFDSAAQARYLAYVSEGHGLTAAAKLTGFNYTTIRKHRLNDDAFEAEIDNAIAEGALALEDEATRRAQGYLEQVIHNGAARWQTDPVTGDLMLDADGKPLPLMKRSQSDILLMFELKARNPARFADHHRVENTNINIDITAPELQDRILMGMNSVSDRLRLGATMKDVTPKNGGVAPVIDVVDITKRPGNS